jgi:putative lipoprotein (rSAM/lipoprotein system)
MKKVQHSILSFSNSVLAVILAMLGFASACGESVDEYGVPSAKFIVKGNVSSAQTSQPVPNIRVVLDQDTVFTNAQGNYIVVDENGFPESRTYSLKFQDIDNDLNGSFTDLDTIAEFNNPVFKGGNGKWYSGEVTKTIDIKLDPKK